MQWTVVLKSLSWSPSPPDAQFFLLLFLVKGIHSACLDIDVSDLQVSDFIQTQAGGVEDSDYCSIPHFSGCSLSLNRRDHGRYDSRLNLRIVEHF